MELRFLNPFSRINIVSITEILLSVSTRIRDGGGGNLLNFFSVHIWIKSFFTKLGPSPTLLEGFCKHRHKLTLSVCIQAEEERLHTDR